MDASTNRTLTRKYILTKEDVAKALIQYVLDSEGIDPDEFEFQAELGITSTNFNNYAVEVKPKTDPELIIKDPLHIIESDTKATNGESDKC